jgi:hypothetical protein
MFPCKALYIPLGTRGSFPRCKAAGAWSWPLTSIYCRGQRMSGAIPPLPQYAFLAWCLVKAQGQLYLYLHLLARALKLHIHTAWEGLYSCTCDEFYSLIIWVEMHFLYSHIPDRRTYALLHYFHVMGSVYFSSLFRVLHSVPRILGCVIGSVLLYLDTVINDVFPKAKL